MPAEEQAGPRPHVLCSSTEGTLCSLCAVQALPHQSRVRCTLAATPAHAHACMQNMQKVSPAHPHRSRRPSMISYVSSTVGSGTCTGWKRLQRAIGKEGRQRGAQCMGLKLAQ